MRSLVPRWFVILLLAIFASVGVLANEPHRHIKHRDCAVCAAAPQETRRRQFVATSQEQAGDGRPAAIAPIVDETVVAVIQNVFLTPAIKVEQEPVLWPEASSVLASAVVGLPPARAPPQL